MSATNNNNNNNNTATTELVDEMKSLSLVNKVVDDASTKSHAELFQQLADHLKSMNSIFKLLQRDLNKKEKSSVKRRPQSKNNFSTPVALSQAMCTFLDIPNGEKLARTEVTRRINSYVKEHGLNDPKNKRIILPDEKLKTILNVADGIELTYFNMQTYNKHNFV